MGNKQSSKGLTDKVDDFTGHLVGAIIVIAIVLYLIYKFITEILIPLLVGLFLVVLAVVLAVTLVRLLLHLISYLTLEKRFRRRIAALSKKLSQLRLNDSTTRQHMADWPAEQRRTAEADLRRRAVKREELTAQRQNDATALADHLADRLARVNKSQKKISRKLAGGGSDTLSQKLEKKNREASLLGARLRRLRTRYYVEPDPAFERKRRKYPLISGFDQHVASLLKRCWNRVARVQPESL